MLYDSLVIMSYDYQVIMLYDSLVIMSYDYQVIMQIYKINQIILDKSKKISNFGTEGAQ